MKLHHQAATGTKLSMILSLLLGLPVAILLSLMWMGSSQDELLISVEGEVTIDGKIVPNAVIHFKPLSEPGVSGIARTDNMGKYKLSSRIDGKVFNGIPPGKYEAVIVVRMTEADDKEGDSIAIPADPPARGQASNAMKLLVEVLPEGGYFDLSYTTKHG